LYSLTASHPRPGRHPGDQDSQQVRRPAQRPRLVGGPAVRAVPLAGVLGRDQPLAATLLSRNAIKASTFHLGFNEDYFFRVNFMYLYDELFTSRKKSS
jgi:hypothetical protein